MAKLKTSINLTVSILLIVLATTSYAAQNNSGATENLSPELRQLLIKEMRAIEKAMIKIIPAIAAGNSMEIANIANNIEKSYILTASLTTKQKNELQEKLPLSFLQLDEKFHYYSGMLAHVALNKKTELVGFYFSKLLESCSNCHSEHAKHKFPNFIVDDHENAHAH